MFSQLSSHLDSVPDVVEHVEVDGFPDEAHRPLRIGRSDDLMRARRVLIGRQDADLPSSHLLFVDVNRLEMGRVRVDLMDFTQ